MWTKHISFHYLWSLDHWVIINLIQVINKKYFTTVLQFLSSLIEFIIKSRRETRKQDVFNQEIVQASKPQGYNSSDNSPNYSPTKGWCHFWWTIVLHNLNRCQIIKLQQIKQLLYVQLLWQYGQSSRKNKSYRWKDASICLRHSFRNQYQ